MLSTLELESNFQASHQFDKDLESVSGISDDSVEDTVKEVPQLPRVTEMEDLLFKGTAFDNFVARLRAFLLPSELQPLLRVILGMPQENAWFERDALGLADRA